ncbi:GPI mannosyltransferase 1 [Trachymyrmex septentrionalis]|uniref:GPI alpha-1,4-mannosyltransferase I, catalytic subunit n=1 Tax=Trachymyrmex septentrionalis TaxID=34720 RepID=A0A195FD94_9HYME|nr:GPI mannosyltransferase 1 [Trachymyrmex septentrionalis]
MITVRPAKLNISSFTLHCLLAFVLRLVLILYANFHDEYLAIPYTDVDYKAMIAVIYNPVITSQYFFWFLSLLPLCLPNIEMNLRRGICLACSWILSQTIWLLTAYLLEFQSFNSFFFLWISGLLFFAVNVKVLVEIIYHYKS